MTSPFTRAAHRGQLINMEILYQSDANLLQESSPTMGDLANRNLPGNDFHPRDTCDCQLLTAIATSSSAMVSI